ncbi:MAG: CpaF family protein, partial [Candidatus Binatia bacterium]
MAADNAGSLSTIHADSPDEALSRLETLARLARDDLGSRAIREQIFAAVELIVHTERDKDGKRVVTSIAEPSAVESDRIKLREIFARAPAAKDLAATGAVPRLCERLGRQGITVDDRWFRKAAG